jgi:hypothetical protein
MSGPVWLMGGGSVALAFGSGFANVRTTFQRQTGARAALPSTVSLRNLPSPQALKAQHAGDLRDVSRRLESASGVG